MATDQLVERAVGSAIAAAAPPRRGKSRSILLGFSFFWVVVMVVVALGVQWMHLPDYKVAVGDVNLPPSWSKEFLGTDALGRSNLARLAWGTRVSLGVSVGGTIIAMTLGGLLGLFAAYFGGFARWLVDVITNSFLAVPALVLLLAIVLALTPSWWSLIAAMSLVYMTPFIRLMRANARSQLTREYVIAAQSMGASNSRIMFREVLPNVILPLLSYAALVMPTMVVTTGALSYLGFGVPPPTPSWGGMIALAQGGLQQAPWPALIPCVALVLNVWSLNTIADWLRVKYDVRDAQL